MSCAHEKAPARQFGDRALGPETPQSLERNSMRNVRNPAPVRNYRDLPLWRAAGAADQGSQLTYPERNLARRYPLGCRARARLVAEILGYRLMEDV
jgi:hypothetical protein